MRSMVEELQEIMVSRGLFLSVAESCTGGLLSAELAKRPGASKYFLGSAVAYSYDAKKQMLGVTQETLETHGAVSKEVALEMAQGVRRVLRSNWALSVTGIAGPDGGTKEKPVGTVWFGFVGPNFEEAVTRVFDGEREKVQSASVLFALEFLLNAVKVEST